MLKYIVTSSFLLLCRCDPGLWFALGSGLENARSQDDRLACITEPYKTNTVPKDNWLYVDWYNVCRETCKKYPEPMKRGIFPITNWNEEKAKKWKEICSSYDKDK